MCLYEQTALETSLILSAVIKEKDDSVVGIQLKMKDSLVFLRGCVYLRLPKVTCFLTSYFFPSNYYIKKINLCWFFFCLFGFVLLCFNNFSPKGENLNILEQANEDFLIMSLLVAFWRCIERLLPGRLGKA